MIQVGDALPDAKLIEKQSEEVSLRSLFAGKRGVLLGMPGAPHTCFAARGDCR